MSNLLAHSTHGLAKFSNLHDPLLKSFVSSIPVKYQDLMTRVKETHVAPSESIISNRIKLADAATKFHEQAATLTPDVQRAIALLREPGARLVVSTHQPNLFSYGGIFKKIVILESLCKDVPDIVNLFVVVDHDFMDETWIRVAQLPSVSHSDGILEVRHKIDEAQRWMLVCNAPLPTKFAIASWRSDIRSWIKSNTEKGAERDRCLENFSHVWKDFEAAYSKASSYADLNSFFMSRIVNLGWKYQTVFVRLSDLSSVFEEGFKFLIAGNDSYSKALKQAELKLMRDGVETGVSATSHLYAPVWIHCQCGSKASPKLKTNTQRVVLEGPCMSCKKDIAVNVGKPDALTLDGSVASISPKAIPIPLLLTRELGITCYASGTGGLGYMVDCAAIAQSLKMNLPEIAVWSSVDKYDGIGQKNARSRSTHEDVADRLGQLEDRNANLEEKVRAMLSKRTAAMQSASEKKAFLDSLFAVKQEQRLIRTEITMLRKILNATMLSPCFLDYAINFGVRETEARWKQHLISNGDLQSDANFLHRLA